MTSAEGGPPLANMSAPPRSILTVKPFQTAAPEAAGILTNWGLAWYARVDFEGHLRALWPEWAEALLDPGRAPTPGAAARRPAAAPQRQLRPSPARKVHLRLCGAVALARGAQSHPWALEPELGEALVDELMRLAPDRASSLPPLLFATPARGPARPLEPDPLRVLAILTHLSGATCDPAGSPLFSEALRESHVLDLWRACP